MKRLIAMLLTLALAGVLAAKEKKTVMIIVDGIPTDVMERLDIPLVNEISSRGAFGHSYVGGETGSYSETPTISAVCYNIMLTGTWVNKHNVYGNSGQKPNYNYWSLFRIAKEQKTPKTTAIFSSWQDNRTILLGENLPGTNYMKIDYVADGYEFDKERFPKKEHDLQIYDYDEEVCRKAAECIRENAPDLSWVYLWYNDDAGHIFGNGAYFDEYVYKECELVSQVWEAVKYREKNFDEEWMVVLLTDHGRTLDGKSHGGQSWRERTTWIATNQKVNTRFRRGEASMVDVNPSVCEFMGFEVPELVRREQDGISFIGKTEIKDMSLYLSDKKNVSIRWKAVKKNVPVSIYVAKANEYKETGREEWIKLAEVKSGEEEYNISLDSIGESDFYKFAVESEHDSLNRWLKN